MNLVQMKELVQEKNNKRNNLLGQKELLLKELKKLGFKTITEAIKANEKMEKELTKMKNQYESGKNKFKKEYKHLLV